MGRQVKKEEANGGLLEWRKIGGGSARLRIAGRRKIAKPNERFWAKPEDIPAGFRDTIVLVDGQKAPKAEKEEKVEKVFGIKKSKKKDGDTVLYDVINKKTKKVMSPNPLTKSQAKSLADTLNK